MYITCYAPMDNLCLYYEHRNKLILPLRPVYLYRLPADITLALNFGFPVVPREEEGNDARPGREPVALSPPAVASTVF